MEPVVKLNAVSKWYGEVIGLNNVTASIGPGITGLLGHNGAGKTTFLSLVTGQLKPSMGSVTVFGKRPWNNPQVFVRLGYCPEVDSFWRGMTGYRFLEALGRMLGLPSRVVKRKVLEVLELVGMVDHKDRPVVHYSRGMRQRIKIAQAMLHEPLLLVLDEPMSGMDPVARSEMSLLFGRLAEGGTSIIVSSHVLYEVEVMTDRFLLIDHGRLIADGSVEEVRRLMEERAHSISLRTDQGRALAGFLVAREYTAGIDLPGDGTVVVRTYNPEEFYRELPNILVENNIHCSEITSEDDSLEAVFGYLTETRK